MTYLRFPILYERSSDDTSTLGLGYLTGILTGTVTRDANAVGVLNLIYNPDDPLAIQLQKGRIILTDCGPDALRQKFRITRVVKGGASVTIEAAQIWGDLAYNTIAKDVSMANASPVDAFNALNSSLTDPIPALTFSSDINKVANVGWDFKKMASALDALVGKDQAGQQTNSMQSLYNGEWVADNYHLKLLQNGGRDTHIVVKYGRNVQTIEQDEAIDKTYTAIMPYATYTPEPTTTEDTSEPYQGVGVVQYVGTGDLEMYDTPYKGHKVTGTVKNGYYYIVARVANKNTVNDDTWYMISTNGWVDGHFFTFDKSGTYAINNVQGAGTIKVEGRDTGLIVPYHGVGSVVSYAGAKSVAVWTTPWGDKHTTGQYLDNGKRYKIWSKATDATGHVWYNIGINSWVDSSFFSIEQNTDYIVTPARGILEIKTDDKGAPVYTAPAGGGSIVQHLKNGTRWQITSIADGGDGKNWYQIATNQWVSNDVVDFSKPGTMPPKSVSDTNTETATAEGKVPIYPKPTYNTSPTGKYLDPGSRWKITAQADNNGTTWYEVGTSAWVDSKWFDFSGSTDVTPTSPTSGDDDGNHEVAEVTVMLPELILKSDLASKDERLRVLPVDLSEYNIQDADKLREVSQAYMQDYRIGYPTVTLTLSYAQLTGPYERLTNIGLYDRVAVQFDALNISEDAEVSEVVWNIVAKRYDVITIGALPISYTHALQQYQQQAVDKATKKVGKQTQGLFDQINRALELKGADQDAAVKKIMEQLGMQGNSIAETKQMMGKINQTVTDVSDWIKSPGSAVIQAYPNWQEPVELRAVNDDGSSMRFNNHGLGYYSSSGLIRSAIDSEGRIVAESITAGTVTGLILEGVQITGTSGISLKPTSGGHETDISAENGISTGGGLEAWSWSRFHDTVTILGDVYVGGAIRSAGNNIFFGGGNAQVKYMDDGYKGAGFYLYWNGTDHHIVTD